MSAVPPELATEYEVLRLLGGGAMGAVYAARERALDRVVALKLVRTRHPALAARLEREAHLMAKVRHPNLAEIYSSGTTPEGPWIAMELIEGTSLDKAPRGSFDPLEVMLAVGRALDALHAAGTLHRDVKPANILLGDSGRVVLADLGIGLDEDRTRLTQEGLVGTMLYMPPEVLRGRTTATPAADWYSWGVTLYELVVGHRPFEGPQLVAAMQGQAPWPTADLDARDLSPEVRRLLATCLDPDPDRRPTSTGDAEAIASGVFELPAPSGEDAGARAKRLPLHVVLPALGFAGLALLGWSMGPPPASPPRKPPPVATEAASPGLAPDARAALLEAARASEDLDPDPREYWRQVRSLPGVEEVMQVIRANRVDEFTPEDRTALRLLDERLHAAGLPRAFSEMLGVRPASEPIRGPLRGRDDNAYIREGEAFGGWMGRAFEQFAASHRVVDRLERSLKTDLPGPIAEIETLRTAVLVTQKFHRDLLLGILHMPRQRIFLAGWVAEAIPAYRSGLAAALRAIREASPAERDAVAYRLARSGNGSEMLFFSGLASVPIELLLGGTPTTPAESFLAAVVLRDQLWQLEAMEGDTGSLLENLVAALEGARADVPPGEIGGERAQWATAYLLDHGARTGDIEGQLRELDRCRPFFRGPVEELDDDLLRYAMASGLSLFQRDSFPRERMREMLEGARRWVATYPAQATPGGKIQAFLRKYEAALAR